MSEPGRRTAPVTVPSETRDPRAPRQDCRELLEAIQATGGRVDAKVAAIATKVAAMDSGAAMGRALLKLKSSLDGRFATFGTRVSTRIEDLDAKLVGRVEALSSQVKANRDSIRDLGTRFQATETAVHGLDARLERVEKALAAIVKAVDAKS